MNDIKSRKAYKDGVKRIQEKLKNAKSQEEIDLIKAFKHPANFKFEGLQTAGSLILNSALEWDLGTYKTNIHINDYNQETG